MTIDTIIFGTLSNGMAIFLLFLIFLIFILTIITLIHQAINRKWGWFFATILLIFLGLGLIVIIIYWILWFSSPKFRRK